MTRILKSAIMLALLTAGTADAWSNATASYAGTFAHDSSREDLIPAPFRLAPEEVVWHQTEAKDFETFKTFKLTFASPVETASVENNTVHCEYFQPATEGRFPAVIVLHILGGDFELSRICCRAMASKNISALFLKMPYYGPRRPPGSHMRMITASPDQTIDNMTQAVKDIRRGADWLAARKEVDGQRLGITGISLGGIVAALAAGVEPRFQKSVFVLAGGDLARIVGESSEMDDVRRVWEGRAITFQQVHEMLAPIDPLTYAARLQDRDVLMFNARRDKVIPRASTEALWKASGEQELVWWNAGHYSAALFLPAGLTRIVGFFGAPSP